MKYLFAICYLLWATMASAQQSERFDEFELHYSIVYSTFLTADIAAQFGIPRGKDKAMLTLSVRDADAGDVEGRPMEISGRTWDLSFSIGSTAFLNLISRLKGPIRPTATPSKHNYGVRSDAACRSF